jgi:hypothetical protein
VTLTSGVLTAPSPPSSRPSKYLRHRHLDPRRRQRQYAIVHDGRQDRAIPLPPVTEHGRAVGIDDQVCCTLGRLK